jgi:SagB-type dehydrogenase family enzyme
MPLWNTIKGRRSERDYVEKPISFSDLSQLLWAAQGITATVGGYRLRAAPSAGALYPVETYVAAHRVEGVEPGVYHYKVREHGLGLIRAGDHGTALEQATVEQDMARLAGAVFVFSAVFDRCKAEYGQRAYRYIYLDAGHIAGQLSLAAVALGLGSCPIAAFYDQEVNHIIRVDGEKESAVYLTAVGRMD